MEGPKNSAGLLYYNLEIIFYKITFVYINGTSTE